MLLAPLLLLMAGLLAWPMTLATRSSLEPAAGGTAGDSVFFRYSRVFSQPRELKALGYSLGLSASVAVVSTIVCLGPAWVLARKRFPGRRIVRAIFVLPMSFAGIIVGFLIALLFGLFGFVPQISERLFGTAWFTGLAYQFAGLVIAYLYFEIPRATLTLESAVRKIDPRLDAAARSLGASIWRRSWLVTMPLLAPALLSTFAVTFSVSLGSFGVLLVLATRRVNLLPMEIFTRYTGFPNDPNAAAAMAIVLVAIAFTVNYGTRALVEGWLSSRGQS